ncbi:hypothetical protein R5R35_007470 [Gryllus longicercus]|uniref:Uncharacterized protein n=1 Tax=Gryllus longicercus TaxID=2509291 RepID=A0AAN9V9E7_9ORTH
MPKKQIIVPTKIKEEQDFYHEDAAEEFADIALKREINTTVVNRRCSGSEWLVTNIKEEKNDSSDVDDAAEFAEIAEKKEIDPIVVIDTHGTRERQEVRDGTKGKKNNVTPNCRLFIKCKPPLLECEIKKLHPDIVAVQALRQKGKYFVTFPNKPASSKALEDLRKTDLKGHTLRVHEYRSRRDCDVPFLFAGRTSKKEIKRRLQEAIACNINDS